MSAPKRIVWIVRTSPMSGGRLAEIARTAAGVVPWKKASITLVLSGNASLGLAAVDAGMAGGEEIEGSFRAFCGEGGEIAVVNAADHEERLRGVSVPFKRVDLRELGRIIQAADSVTTFL